MPNVRNWRLAVFICVPALLAAAPTAAQSDDGTTAAPSSALSSSGRATASPPASTASPVLTHDADGRVIVRATRITQPIKIDGRLDDAAYRLVPPITEFIQAAPETGAPVTEKTEVWVMFDDKNMYLSCHCWDRHPERIVANDTRRDSAALSNHDNLAIELDTFHDRRNGMLFVITAAGGLRDGLATDATSVNMDWNGVWDGRTSRSDTGWIAEIAIPFKTLRYNPGREQTWGIQIRRLLAGQNELGFLTPVSPAWGIGAINYMSVAATLVGLEVPPSTLNLEVKPYVINNVTTDLLSGPAVRNQDKPNAGVDVKYGVTKSLTADVTYNTDFAQVEADDAQVNLTRFSLMFPEKRDFFLEGQGLFTFGSPPGDVGGADAPIIFYTRRIGLSGARAVPVIGGGRLNGKAGPWSVGALNMETSDDAAAGALRTNFSVLRLRRNVLRRSNVGGIFTRRSVSTVAPGANDVWGLDANFAFYQNVYVSGYLVQSRTEGLRDNDIAYRSQFNYNTDRYGLAFDRNVVEKHFNPEIGFLRRTDFRRNLAQARFSPRTKNNRLVRQYTYQGSFEYIADNQNRLQSRTQRALYQTAFQNSDLLAVDVQRLYELLPAPFQISKGVTVPTGAYDYHRAITSYTLGAQHRVSGVASVEIGSLYGGDKKTIGFALGNGGRVNVTSRLGVEPNISLNWIHLPQGKFTTTVVGQRAIFTMTPRMFVTALMQYQSSNTSLSTNVRFRWEYRPGSELFVVYTEGRSTLPPSGTELQNRGLAVKINRLLRF